MNYEKTYNEALERAKKMYYAPNADKIPTYANRVIEEIFHELGESEDEKIRKGIIDFLWKEKIFLQEAHSSVENNPKYRFVMDAIAWLEKQGEKPKGKSALEVWKDMRLEVYQQASGNRHEPNYSDDSTKMFSLNDIDEIIEKISKQKHTWSEEDEEYMSDVIAFLEDARDCRQNALDCIEWMKQLKERLS